MSNEKIVNTLIKLRNRGLTKGTLTNISFNLKHLAKHADLAKPESIAAFISTKECANSFKENLVKTYNYYALTNGMHAYVYQRIKKPVVTDN